MFNRILVTGSHPARYLFGKAGSIFCVTFVQFALLIVASQFIFDLFPNRSIKFWFGMVFILVLYSLCVAALTMLFTSLTFRIKESAATGILTLIIMVIGCAEEASHPFTSYLIGLSTLENGHLMACHYPSLLVDPA